MKRNLSKLAFMAIAVLAGVVLCVQTASAQAKRKPTAKPAARQAAKPAAKKPAEKVNNNFAILEFDEWINDNNPFEDEEYIYFLDYPGGSSNALRAVNKKTGEVKLVVPKKKRARTKICSAGSDGKNIYMRLEGKGIALFNGTDVNTSELVFPQNDKGFLSYGNRGSNIITSPNGRYLFFYGDSPILYDLEKKQVMRVGISSTTIGAIVTDDGLLIGTDYSEIFTGGRNPNVTPDTGSPKNREGLKVTRGNKIDNGAGGDFCSIWYDAADTTVYVAIGEQVLKSKAVADLKFQEVYCLPGENKKFTKVVCNGKRVFALTDHYEKHIYEWDNKDMTGTPKISKELDTGIHYTDKYGYTDPNTKKVSYVGRIFFDSMGNLWMQESDARFYIYNPDGIQGLTTLKGKWTKNELPKEED